ncbi:hypothetical protein O6H91_20G076900 [Diphasiastrum complanatum]|uniref:Uncharacterized protein n=1 Tax=Diphasiastrum complanatum TaxID=34168 RepID=A0ACC2AS56_DIPCM|nr:hypothetical protein O6H91_20G076900 [Diphasiastrum complanatum]
MSCLCITTNLCLKDSAIKFSHNAHYTLSESESSSPLRTASTMDAKPSSLEVPPLDVQSTVVNSDRQKHVLALQSSMIASISTLDIDELQALDESIRQEFRSIHVLDNLVTLL